MPVPWTPDRRAARAIVRGTFDRDARRGLPAGASLSAEYTFDPRVLSDAELRRIVRSEVSPFEFVTEPQP